MIIKTIKFCDVNRAAYNPRIELKPGMPEYEKLKKSVKTFGHVLPLVFNKTTGTLCGGHQTMTVLEEMGKTEAEMSIVELDVNHEKALNIVLNKAQGLWDDFKLADILTELGDITNFDIEITGFDLDEMIAACVTPLDTDTDKPPEEFTEYTEDMETKNECPKCGYRY